MRSFTLILITLALACSGAPSAPPGVPGGTPAGSWRAQTGDGRPLPAAILLFDPVEEDGRQKSIHFVADSATMVLLADGRYQHRVWFSEWEGASGGGPERLRFRFYHGDHGSWTGATGAMDFDSAWIQNHRMTGAFDDGTGRLVVQHGLGPGEPPAAFVYRR